MIELKRRLKLPPPRFMALWDSAIFRNVLFRQAPSNGQRVYQCARAEIGSRQLLFLAAVCNSPALFGWYITGWTTFEIIA